MEREQEVRILLQDFEQTLEKSAAVRAEIARLQRVEAEQDKRAQSFAQMKQQWGPDVDTRTIIPSARYESDELREITPIPESFNLHASAYLENTQQCISLYKDSLMPWRYILKIESPDGVSFRYFDNAEDPYQHRVITPDTE